VTTIEHAVSGRLNEHDSLTPSEKFRMGGVGAEDDYSGTGLGGPKGRAQPKMAYGASRRPATGATSVKAEQCYGYQEENLQLKEK
jgi:hypothetical protein